MPTQTLAALIAQLQASDPAIAAAIVAGNDQAVADALNAPRSDIQLSRGLVPIEALVPEAPFARLATMPAALKGVFDTAALLRVVNFDDANVRAAADYLSIRTTRDGSLAEQAGLGPVHHLDVARALRPA